MPSLPHIVKAGKYGIKLSVMRPILEGYIVLLPVPVKDEEPLWQILHFTQEGSFKDGRIFTDYIEAKKCYDLI